MKLFIGLDQFNLNGRVELSNKLHPKLSNKHTKKSFFKRKNTLKPYIYH